MKNSGFDVSEIQEIYEHVFINKHLLDGGFKRFDPNYDMAESWRRVSEGKDIQEYDMIMLKHELMESSLMAQ